MSELHQHDAVEAAREIHVPKVVAYDSHLEAGIRPVIETAQDRRVALRAKTEQGLTDIFPIKGRTKTLTVENVKTRPAVYSMQDQKTALLHGRSLAEPVVGDLVLRDNTTGEELDRKKNHVLAHVPYFTERHTFVLGGNEYELPHQVRLDAGVYTRERGNGELETSFNLSKGRNFRLTMAPETGKLRMELGTSVLPLRPVLEHLGVSSDALKKAWGDELFHGNAATDMMHASTLDKLVDKLSYPGEITPSDRDSLRTWAKERFDKTRMNPRVAQTTIGTAHDRASPQAILDASKKLLRAHRGDLTAFDDRDSLEFKHLMRAEDFFHERLLKDAKRTIAPKLGWKIDKAAPGAKLKDIVPSSTFTKSLNTFLTNSAIAAIPSQFNPIEILDHAAKITSLGEGGIGSERAISMESRGVHGSSIGIMDPVRTPECYDDQTEVFTSKGWVFWRDVSHETQFACRVEGRMEFHAPEKLHAAQYAGVMYGVRNAKINYLVTPNHRVLYRVVDSPGASEWKIDTADKVYGRSVFFDTRQEGHAGDASIDTFTVPTVTGSNSVKNAPPIAIDDWAELLGWYLSEGCTYCDSERSSYAVHIGQCPDANPAKYARLRALLERLPFAFQEPRGGRRFVIQTKQLAVYLEQFGLCFEKHIPEEAFSWPYSARQRLWESLMLGDGTRVTVRDGHATEEVSYNTSSPQLARDVERLATTLGHSVRISRATTDRRPNHRQMYIVRVFARRERAAYKKREDHVMQQYSGMVYCATVPGGLLYVRRHGGIPIWSGNSGHAGVDVRAAIGAHKDEHGHLYGTFIDRHGKAVLVPASIIARSVIGHAHEYQRGGARVDALEGTDNIRTARTNVDYWVPNPTSLYSPATNLIPFIDGIQGNRAIMGAKFQTQSLPLVEKEAPLVRPSSMDGVTSMTELLGAFIDPTTPVSGTVTKIDPHYIYVKRDTAKHASDAKTENLPKFETSRHVERDAATSDLFDIPDEAWTLDGTPLESVWFGARAAILVPGDEDPEYDLDEVVDYPDGEKETRRALIQRTMHVLREQGRHDVAEEDVIRAERKHHNSLVLKTPNEKNASAELTKIALSSGSPPGAKPASSYAPGSALRAVREEQARAHHDDTDTVRIPYYDRFPLATKTELHHDLTAKVGDRVAAGASLGTSNFTADGHVANGRNLSVAYIAYYGKNSNDAVVISDAAADKLTSEHAYKETLLKTKDTLQGKAKFQAYFPTKYTAAQLQKLDDKGIAKPGSTFDPGDPLILALEPSTISPEERLLGNLHKSLVKPYRNASVIWEHVTAGKASEVSDIARQTTVVMATREKMKVGDKLSNRFGGKGVVADILPNEHMIQDAKGKPIDVLFTSAGINSRINPAQVVEVALGKVAQHTGKPIQVPQFADFDNVAYAKDLLKKHGLSDKETVYDPIGDRHIPNIHVGTSYIHKLFKNTETNFSARGVAGYDVNKQPTKGGVGGAKGLGRMEINTFLAHDARHFLRDAFTHKSEQSEAFWRSFEHGMPLPPRKTPFVTEKLLAMLGGAGIAAKREGSLLRLAPMRDEDVRAMSSGALRPPSLEHSTSFLVSAKKLEPEKGGLFDPALTGGVSGSKWSHIELPERTVQPAFFDAARVILGTTAQQLRDKIAEGGGEAVAKMLDAKSVDERLKGLYVDNRTLRGAALDKNVKAIKYLEALKQQGISHASEAYTAKLVAVIPPVMRPILPSRGSADLQVADANYLYRDVALAAKNLEAAHGTGSPTLVSEARKHLYDAHAALAGVGEPVSPQLQGRDVKGFVQTITGSGSPKTGFLFSKVIKRQHDLTGRATATPDATLELDQIGVPEDILWTTYGKFVMKGLIAQGYAPVAARELLEKRSPLAKAVLERELKERPVYVNRAPSLHKHNMVAAYPVSVSGTNLRVNPFMEKGMNLDYDGDTMQVHVPLSDAAKHEAKQLTMKQLLFSDRTRDDLLVFPQHEAIIGAYLATRGAAKGAVKKFATKADAQAAYRRGEIGLDTPVEIGAAS